MEAQKLITMSLGKIASSRCQRGGINLHRNLLVASVLHKARTVYMMDTYQHIIASRKQEQESLDSTEKGGVCESVKLGAGSSQSSAMTHNQAISHSEDKENSPPTVSPACQDKGVVVMQGVEQNTIITRTEPVVGEEISQRATECKLSTTNISSSKNNGASLKICQQNRPSSGTAGKRRRSRNAESSDLYSSEDSALSPKKAKLDNSQDSELVSERENYTENNSSNVLLSSHHDISSINDSGVTCKVTNLPCDRSEPMQAESTQITSLVTIFNSGFTGLCSRSSSNTESNSSSQSQPLSCATELKHGSVQMPSVIALTV